MKKYLDDENKEKTIKNEYEKLRKDILDEINVSGKKTLEQFKKNCWMMNI